MNTSRFFVPWKPKDYDKGIKGKKILVVGASYYCTKTKCDYMPDCTNKKTKDSSAYDSICPYNNGHYLHDEPKYTTGETTPYKKFQKIFEPYYQEKENIWDEVLAFTNYIQFFFSVNEKYTNASDFSDRDRFAFIQTLNELKPDIVITWGTQVEHDIRNYFKKDIIDFDKLTESQGYLLHIKLKDINKVITLLQVYHPSDQFRWYSGFNNAVKYLGIALNE